TILTPSMKTDSKTFYDNFYRDENFTYEQYKKQILSSYHNRTFMSSSIPAASSTGNETVITYIQSLPYGEPDNMGGNLVILINQKQIESVLTEIEGLHDGTIFILNRDREILLGPNSFNDLDQI